MEDRESLKADLQRAREESARLRSENLRLRRENTRLRAKDNPSAADGQIAMQLQMEDSSPDKLVNSGSSPQDKIGLFKRLFRGREDVYAARWERPDGRAGYVPASRCRADRERGVFLPLTDEVFQCHRTRLRGH